MRKSLPFSVSKQHVKNVDMMLQCDECGLWRLLYCKRKLKQERELLERELDGLMYTCGTSLQDLKLDPPLDEVYIRDITCADHIEKLLFCWVRTNLHILCMCHRTLIFSLSAVTVHNQKFPGDRITLETYLYIYLLHAFFLYFVCVL